MDADTGLPADLARETEALRRVARAIVFEPALAEDVVQEAWLAALGARGVASVGGGWLTEAVRRIARNFVRDANRRSAREHASARPEALPSTAETASRLEILRSLVTALEELEEPYRTAVRLRVIDELPPRAIARQLGVPVETVRTRVKRGIERLREGLDARHADRRAEFLAALAPLAGLDPLRVALGAHATTNLGGVLVGTKVKVAVALAIVVVAGTWWSVASDGRRPLAVDEPGVSAGELARHDEPTPKATTESAALAVDPPSLARDEPVSVRIATPTSDWIVRGRVVDERRQPIAGASVRAQVVSGYDGEGETLLGQVLTTDAAGEFARALERVDGAARVRLTPSAPGFLGSFTEELVKRGATPPNFTLRLYRTDVHAKGRVVDPDGTPIPHATLVARMWRGATDAQGRFELAAPSELRPLTIEAWAPGFVAGALAVDVAGPAELDGLELRLARGVLLAGRVVDEDGGAVARASVESWAIRGDPALTDAEGRFAFDRAPATLDWLDLMVHADGFAALKFTQRGWRAPGAEIELVLERGIVVRGRVVDATGSPLEGANVHSGDERWSSDASTATSDELGRFVLQRVRRAETHVGAELEGYLPERVELASSDVELVLQRGVEARGVVVDELGTPVPGAPVIARVGWDYTDTVTQCDAEGRFVLTAVPDVEGVLLETYPAGWMRAVARFPRDGSEVRLVLARGGGFAGRVVDAATGKPVTHFRVRFVTPQLEPGEERIGGYSAEWQEPGLGFDDPRGIWTTKNELFAIGAVAGIEIAAHGYGSHVVARVAATSNPDPEALVIELGPALGARGRVVDAATGAPIADARVRAHSDREPVAFWSTQPSPRDVRADARGEFILDDLPDEPLSLFVEAAGFAAKYDGPFEPTPRGGARTIELVHGASIVGRVADVGGHALADESMRLAAIGVPGESERRWSTTTDAEGHFEFADLSPGRYQVMRELVHESGSVYDGGLTVEVAGTARVEVELRPKGSLRIEGTVRVANALSAAVELPHTVGVTARRATDLGWRAALATDGRFELDGLEPGAWELDAWVYRGGIGEHLHGTAHVELLAGSNASVEIELAK
ncbi:MAG: sigma-70 family RNA polymerase sigma factor [Planctomycetes bacterium]|nr:sigma-70 family RNA polymerase sigma factor [Planctomycetota bacterium]